MGIHDFMRKAKHSLQDRVGIEEKHSHTHDGHECQQDHEHSTNRYASFAPQTSGHAKWYVDGASYFWAVSMALECRTPPLGTPRSPADGVSSCSEVHLHPGLVAEVFAPCRGKPRVRLIDNHSPELYLRRPPSRNEQYRLDRMLRAAAERGVLIYVIVYKEVEAALTCWFSPESIEVADTNGGSELNRTGSNPMELLKLTDQSTPNTLLRPFTRTSRCSGTQTITPPSPW